MKSDLAEHEKARAWREKRKLTQAQLASLTGFSREAIFWFERGTTAPYTGHPPRPISPWVMQRYKLCCAGLHYALKTKKAWDWK
jgi:transcriptional regulator with XRE-family HTH domain